MAATLADLALQQHFQPSNAVQTAGSAANTAIGLANAVQQQQANKIKLQQMQDELSQQRFNTAIGSLQTLARMSPAVAKLAAPKVQENFQKAGINVDPGVIKLMSSDEGFRQRFRSIAQGLSLQGMNDPAVREQAMQALSDVGETDKGIDLFAQQSKMQAAGQLKQAQIEGALKAAQIRANATVQASQNRSQNMQVRNQLQANRQYAQELGPLENGLQQANKAEQLVREIQQGGLQGNKSLRSDLSATLASLVNQGRAATVFGQHSTEFNSLYASAKDAMNYLQGTASNTIPPAQLEQLMKDVSAMKDIYAQQHAIKFNSFLQGVPTQFQAPLQNRFDSFSQAISGGKDQSNDPAFMQKVQKAIQAGHSPDEISAHLKQLRGYGLTPAELHKASPATAQPEQPAQPPATQGAMAQPEMTSPLEQAAFGDSGDYSMNQQPQSQGAGTQQPEDNEAAQEA